MFSFLMEDKKILTYLIKHIKNQMGLKPYKRRNVTDKLFQDYT